LNKTDSNYIERHYHLSWGGEWRRSAIYGFPILKAESYIPDRVIPFDKIDKVNDTRGCVMFHLADRRIDRLWNNPEKYFTRLREFDCVTTPDFSLLLDMDRAFIAFNILRALKIGRQMKDLGMRVLPTAMWACPDTYDMCFEALPRHSIVFVSTVGAVRRRDSARYFMMGMRAMLDRVMPSGVVLYGAMPSFDFPVPVVRHFDRVSPTCFNSYQPDLI